MKKTIALLAALFGLVGPALAGSGFNVVGGTATATNQFLATNFGDVAVMKPGYGWAGHEGSGMFLKQTFGENEAIGFAIQNDPVVVFDKANSFADFLVSILTVHGDASNLGIILDYVGLGIFSNFNGSRYKIGYAFSGVEHHNLTVAGLNLGSTDDATEMLDVHGNAKISGGVVTSTFTMPTGAGAGKVLTSDADGVGTWETAGGGGGRTVVNYVAGNGGTSGSSGVFVVIATVPANTVSANGDYVTVHIVYKDNHSVTGGSCGVVFFGADGFVNPSPTGFGTIDILMKRTSLGIQNTMDSTITAGAILNESQATAFDETVDQTISMEAFQASCTLYSATVTY